MTIFVTRQLSTKINATYKIMALVSLMLLLAMGALITGFNLNSVIERENDKKIAHDYTLTLVNANPKIVMKNAKYVTFDKHFVKQVSPLEIFTDYTQNAEAFAPYVKDANLVYVYKHESMRFVKASEFNDLRVYKGLEPVHIDDDSFAVFSQAIAFDGKLYQFQDGLKDSATLNVNGKTLTRVPLAEDGVKLTNGSELSSIYILLSDAQYNTLRDSKLERYSLNANWIVDLETGVDQEKFSRTVKDMLVMHGVDDFDIIGISEQALIDTQNGVKVMFTFIALYLGSVFLITSVVLLALQQLSEAGDNQKRYKTLSKIGVDEHMINRSLLIQMALYFFFPLTIALMHTYVGITAINMNLNIVGLKPTTLLPAIGTLVFIFVVYGAYFVVTYSGSKSIIRRKG